MTRGSSAGMRHALFLSMCLTQATVGSPPVKPRTTESPVTVSTTTDEPCKWERGARANLGCAGHNSSASTVQHTQVHLCSSRWRGGGAGAVARGRQQPLLGGLEGLLQLLPGAPRRPQLLAPRHRAARPAARCPPGPVGHRRLLCPGLRLLFPPACCLCRRPSVCWLRFKGLCRCKIGGAHPHSHHGGQPAESTYCNTGTATAKVHLAWHGRPPWSSSGAVGAAGSEGKVQIVQVCTVVGGAAPPACICSPTSTGPTHLSVQPHPEALVDGAAAQPGRGERAAVVRPRGCGSASEQCQGPALAAPSTRRTQLGRSEPALGLVPAPQSAPRR